MSIEKNILYIINQIKLPWRLFTRNSAYGVKLCSRLIIWRCLRFKWLMASRLYAGLWSYIISHGYNNTIYNTPYITCSEKTIVPRPLCGSNCIEVVRDASKMALFIKSPHTPSWNALHKRWKWNNDGWKKYNSKSLCTLFAGDFPICENCNCFAAVFVYISACVSLCVLWKAFANGYIRIIRECLHIKPELRIRAFERFNLIQHILIIADEFLLRMAQWIFN